MAVTGMAIGMEAGELDGMGDIEAVNGMEAVGMEDIVGVDGMEVVVGMGVGIFTDRVNSQHSF